MRKGRAGLGGGILAALLALACSHASEGDGTGVVRALAADGRAVTLEHGDIPGLMRGMTMEFAVERPELLAGVAVGETVDFHLRYENGVYTVTALRERTP